MRIWENLVRQQVHIVIIKIDDLVRLEHHENIRIAEHNFRHVITPSLPRASSHKTSFPT